MKRYHKNILFPEWVNSSFERFRTTIYNSGPLSFSSHSLNKIIGYVGDYGKIVFMDSINNILKSGAVTEKLMFEFYANDRDIVKGVFRYILPGLPIDLVMVISVNCTIVTVYIVNKDDSHLDLRKDLYVRKESKSAKN